MATLNLLNNTSRVEVPFVKVTIGEYSFGVYDKKTYKGYDEQGVYKLTKIKYPNYIQSLSIKKINGKLNSYTLNISYPITEKDDPNFFEKVFSSVSKSRKIIFSYGDLASPTFTYRDEEATIMTITNQFAISSATINYTITAISSAIVASSGAYTFKARFAKPSDVIKELLYNKKFGLQEVFYGMRDKSLVENNSLILGDDKAVEIGMKTNISPLDYLTYLVTLMTPLEDTHQSIKKSGLYSIVIIDDTSGIFGGPYFKIQKITKKSSIDKLETYHIDIGYPSENIVTSFTIDNNESYSILYNYSEELTNNEVYSERINDKGELEQVYAPILSSGNDKYKTTESERNWWTKVTEFPVKAALTLKGLLRPSILMTHVKLNVYFYGRKHISSGTYIITQQVDQIDFNGFRTTLSLTRVAADDLNII